MRSICGWRHTFHVHERPAKRPQIDLLADLFKLRELLTDGNLRDGVELHRDARLGDCEAKATPCVPHFRRRNRLGAGGNNVSPTAARETLTVVRVVHPLVAIVIAKGRKLGDHLLLCAGATATALRSALTEEPHARRSLFLELSIQVVPQALPGRRRETRFRQIPEHDPLARDDHVHRQVGLAAIRRVEESGRVEQRVAPRDTCDAGRTAICVTLDPRVLSLIELERFDRLAIEGTAPIA